MSRNKRATAKRLRDRVLEHLEVVHTEMKPSVLRRAAQRIGLDILGNRLTCWDPIHLGTLKTTVGLERAVRNRFGPLVDLACQRLFHGHVLPLQRALVIIDEAESAALGKCVCRAAGVTNDLYHNGNVRFIAEPAIIAEHLDNILAIYNTLPSNPGVGESTAPQLLDILQTISSNESLDPAQRLGALFEGSFPHWEILLSHERFTPKWRENMKRHHKSWPVHRELLKALVQAHYHTRGAIFTAMEVVDETYAMCTCPGPENDQGCSLVNWYYFSKMDHALFPNTDDFHGQARDDNGKPLPCRRFVERGSRPCLGCGCEHDEIERESS